MHRTDGRPVAVAGPGERLPRHQPDFAAGINTLDFHKVVNVLKSPQTTATLTPYLQ